MAADPLYADPRIGTADVDSWRAVPVEDNPEGKRTWAWAVVAGGRADEGDPDVYFEIRHAEYPEDVAKFVVQAVRNEYARVREEVGPR